MILHPDFRDLLAAFAAGNVRYLVIGGYAVGFHDRPRYTKDIDLWIDPESANLARCAQALEEFGAPQNVITAIAANDPDTIVWMGVPPQRIDLLTDVPGAEFVTAYARRVDTTWDDQIVSVVGLDDLIATKRAANRDKDQLDAKHLERVRARRDS
jgi:hypothetical protein